MAAETLRLQDPEIIEHLKKLEHGDKAMQAYRSAMRLAQNQKDTGTVTQVAHRLEKKGNSVSPLQLTVCAQVWMSAKRGKEKTTVFDAILKSIASMSAQAREMSSLTKFSYYDDYSMRNYTIRKPHEVLGRFFKAAINNLAKNHNGKEGLAITLKDLPIKDFWVSVFFLWDDVGLLFDKEIDWESWRNIRKIVDRNFACDHKAELCGVLLPRRVQTISFFLHDTPQFLHQIIRDMNFEASDGNAAFLEKEVLSLLPRFAEQLARMQFQDKVDSLEEWISLWKALSKCDMKTSLRSHIDRIVSFGSFRKCSTLQVYMSIATAGATSTNENWIFDAICIHMAWRWFRV